MGATGGPRCVLNWFSKNPSGRRIFVSFRDGAWSFYTLTRHSVKSSILVSASGHQSNTSSIKGIFRPAGTVVRVTRADDNDGGPGGRGLTKARMTARRPRPVPRGVPSISVKVNNGHTCERLSEPLKRIGQIRLGINRLALGGATMCIHQDFVIFCNIFFFFCIYFNNQPKYQLIGTS